jgi:hypothetical protein
VSAVTDTLTAHGITMTLKQWSRRNKIAVSTIKYRLRRGVDPARAVDPRPLSRKKTQCSNSTINRESSK